jgi:hypothetical protein
MHEV